MSRRKLSDAGVASQVFAPPAAPLPGDFLRLSDQPSPLSATYLVYSAPATPTNTNTTAPPLTSVATGPFHTLLLHTPTTLYGIGWNGHSQLALPQTLEYTPNPTQITFPTPVHITAVACGTYHSACTTKDGSVYTWGLNSVSQLGYTAKTIIENYTHTHTDRRHSKDTSLDKGTSIPIKVPNITQAAEVACGGTFTVVLTRTGKVYSFGSNEFGELGTAPGAPCIAGSPLRSSATFVEVAAGEHHVVLRDDTGAVHTTGCGTNGRLGVPAPAVGLNKMTTFDVFGKFVEKVYAGGDFNVVVDYDGNGYIFGGNGSGMGGVGDTVTSWKPRRIPGLKIMDVGVGEQHCVFLDTHHRVWAAGKNSVGRLGVLDADCDTMVVTGFAVDEGDDKYDDDADVIVVNDAESTYAIVVGKGDDTFAEAIRELEEDAAKIVKPICLGTIGETADEWMGGVAAGAGNSFAFAKSHGKVRKRPALVKCRYGAFGCRGRTHKNSLLSHEMICPFRVEKCPYLCFGCDEDRVPWSLFERHKETCSFRTVTCEHCEVEMSAATLPEHEKEFCAKILIPCYFCEEGFSREDLIVHVEEVCENVTIDCPNRCRREGWRRGDLVGHLCDCPRRLVQCEECGGEVPLDFIDKHKKCCEGKGREEEGGKEENPKRTGGGFALEEKKPKASQKGKRK